CARHPPAGPLLAARDRERRARGPRARPPRGSAKYLICGASDDWRVAECADQPIESIFTSFDREPVRIVLCMGVRMIRARRAGPLVLGICLAQIIVAVAPRPAAADPQWVDDFKNKA